MAKKYKYIVNENTDYYVVVDAENEDDAIDIGRNIDGSEFEPIVKNIFDTPFWTFSRVEEIKEGEEMTENKTQNGLTNLSKTILKLPIAEFKPIHLFNHSTNESFQIITREGLIAWLNDYANVENHSAFDSYEELAKYIKEGEE